MLVSNNGQYPVEVINPDFGLNQPFVKLIEGLKYIVAPLNEDDIKYTNITVKLAQIFFVSPDIKNLTDADPEDPQTMTVGAQIDLGHSSVGGSSDFIVPSNLPHGNYVLFVYLQYPYGITGVFSNIATVTGSINNNSSIDLLHN
jgi:hypothetical protein